MTDAPSFEANPHPLFAEDWSRSKHYAETLRSCKVRDLPGHCDAHPEEVRRMLDFVCAFSWSANIRPTPKFGGALLRKLGFDPVVAVSGPKVIAAVAAALLDTIMISFEIPEMSGTGHRRELSRCGCLMRPFAE